MKHIMLLVAFVTTLSICNLVVAQEELPKPQPVLVVGVFEALGVAATPQHYGAYATVMGGVIIPVDQTLTLIPMGGLTFCPEFGNWGIAGFLVFDFYLTERNGVILTLEPFVTVAHDAMPNGDGTFSHNVMPGVGIGPTLIFKRFVLSPNVAIYADIKNHGAVLAPTFLFSVPF
jgi:hypothetical protein